ncbi:MAG TPA: hypothetical protein PKJ86_01005 [Candidatus Dojkabacteria bacterium]|mgnify:FL=1|nr:hypothetical protein [Candidatus Dojkabacteria bacterium]
MTGNEIPALFWMFVIGALTILVCLILYYIAMVMKEAASTVAESRTLIKSSNEILVDAHETVNSVQSMLEDVRTSIVNPIGRVGGLITSIADTIESFTSFVSRFKK